MKQMENNIKIKNILAIIKREEAIRKLLKKSKKEGIKYIYFIKLLGANKSNFSLFVNGKTGISKKNLLILEDYFKKVK